MIARRDAISQQSPQPGQDLEKFPSVRLDGGTGMFRAHQRSLGPWWFSHSPGFGRFDLGEPHGTCYLAQTAEAAVREVIGPRLLQAGGGQVPDTFLDRYLVSTLALPGPVEAADITVDTLGHGVVGKELSATVPYAVSCRWATAFHDHGFDGIWCSPRYSGSDSRALALFGAAGSPDAATTDPWPQSLRSVAGAMTDLRVLTVPASLAEVHLLDEPHGE